MTWSYSGDPASSDKDEIRFLVGDTDSTNQQISDEEINYLVGMYPKDAAVPNYIAAAAAATTIAGLYSSKLSKTVGSLSVRYEEQHSKYEAMADRYTMLALKGPSGKGAKMGAPQVFGTGKIYLGPDDTPDEYSQ